MKSSFEAYIEDPTNNRLVKDILLELKKRRHDSFDFSHRFPYLEKKIINPPVIDGNIVLFSEDPYNPKLPADFLTAVRGTDRIREKPPHRIEIYIGNFMDRPETYSDMSPVEQENIVKSACDKIEEVQKNHFNFTISNT